MTAARTACSAGSRVGRDCSAKATRPIRQKAENVIVTFVCSGSSAPTDQTENGQNRGAGQLFLPIFGKMAPKCVTVRLCFRRCFRILCKFRHIWPGETSLHHSNRACQRIKSDKADRGSGFPDLREAALFPIAVINLLQRCRFIVHILVTGS